MEEGPALGARRGGAFPGSGRRVGEAVYSGDLLLHLLSERDRQADARDKAPAGPPEVDVVCVEVLPSCGHSGNGISEAGEAGSDLGT